MADILKISLSSAHGYLSDYASNEKIKNDPYEGKPCKISQEQEIELKAHLKQYTYSES